MSARERVWAVSDGLNHVSNLQPTRNPTPEGAWQMLPWRYYRAVLVAPSPARPAARAHALGVPVPDCGPGHASVCVYQSARRAPALPPQAGSSTATCSCCESESVSVSVHVHASHAPLRTLVGYRMHLLV